MNIFYSKCLYLLLIISTFSISSEYDSYPLSGHPNYKDPSNFKEFNVDLTKSLLLEGITYDSAETLCKSITKGGTIELVSNGGSISAGWKIMDCIYNKDVTIAVREAYSMATSILLSGSKVCMFPKAPLGFHQPIITSFGSLSSNNLDKLQNVLKRERNKLKSLGYSEDKINYLEDFGLISSETDVLAMMPLGTMAGILGKRFKGYCKIL
jgi:hypothetical protein